MAYSRWFFRRMHRMQTIVDLGVAFADRRRLLGRKQGGLARQAGIAQEMLSRPNSLDDLRRERVNA